MEDFESMLPRNVSIFAEPDIELEELPTRTYAMVGNRLSGYYDGRAAMEQTIYCIMNSERFFYQIYSWDYGIQLEDLYGKPMDYVAAMLTVRIPEALLQDTRILSIEDLRIEHERRTIKPNFTARTIWGDIPIEKGMIAYNV